MGCGTSKTAEDGGENPKEVIASLDGQGKSKGSVIAKPDRMSMMSQEMVKPGQVNNDARRLAIPLEQQSIEDEFGEQDIDIESMEGYKATTPEEQAEYEVVEKAMHTHYLFNDLAIESLQKVIGAMDKVEVGAGKTVIEQGDSDANYFYVVSKGELMISIGKRSLAKRKKYSVQTGTAIPNKSYGVGACFGELALLYNTVRNASIISKTECSLWRLDRSTFRKLLLNYSSESKKMNFLRIVPLFRDLSDHTLSQWGQSLAQSSYKAGERIFTAGDAARFCVVYKGEVFYKKNEHDVR